MTHYHGTNGYKQFLEQKRVIAQPVGKKIDLADINPVLFPFQRDIVKWAIGKGRSSIFADTGLGKTIMQVEWARLIGEQTLIVAPLSVARQTVREAKRLLNVDVHYTRSGDDVVDGINITNYEMVGHFDNIHFGAVVLDESSILKALDGKTRRRLTSRFADTPYRLCCTATPAPNDMTELGNHAEFLGICSEAEMRAMFFINANKEHTIVDEAGKVYRRKGSNIGGQEWRLKHPAEKPFFRWLSSWAMSVTKPSDLGYDDDGFVLPSLNIHPQFLRADYTPDDKLFFDGLHGIGDRHRVRRQTLDARIEELKRLIADSDDQWIIWCGLDEESKQAALLSDDAIEVKGSHTPEYKAQAFEDFQDGKYRILVTKGRVGGFGMNFQNAHNMAFLGLNDSWETWYQCIRREWRYGQTKPVNVHVIMSDIEAEIYHNVMRKDAMASRLRAGMIEHVSSFEKEELTMNDVPVEEVVETDIVVGEKYKLMLGDSCQRLAEIEDNSIDMSVYSPPFADLFVYSNSIHDLGNSRGVDEFFQHYGFIIREVLRVTKPGRLSCVHTSDIPAMASRDGYIGVKDFPGAVIRAHEDNGWTFVGRAFVQKNPQSQAIRVKSKALLFVQMRKDSSDSRPALVDQILIFKKDGDNEVPVTPVANGEMDNETWIEWAHGIWLGIHETDTLQYGIARGEDDEKHICPLQLGTIERCVKLYSNPGETVLSPFAGIGSEGYEAVRLGRKFIGIELKPEYWKVASMNLNKIELATKVPDLFDFAGVDV